MMGTLFHAFRLLRPKQWIKNGAIFAAITFNGKLFDLEIFSKVSLGFVGFCAISSAIYIINDVFDIKRDRLHRYKKYRPLVHGDISLHQAWVLAISLILFSLWVGFLINLTFFLLMIIYFVLQLSYSAKLKHIAIIDILILAAGYILRVYGGEFASGLHISVWLLLTTISISLLLAVGKRRSELTLLLSQNVSARVDSTRKSLLRYSERLLDVYASIFATSTFISYALFTFLENETGFKISIGLFMPEFLPSFFQRKWLMVTIAPGVYGLMKYLENVYAKGEGENPERILFSDTALLLTVIVWILLVIGMIYFVGP